MRNYFVPIFSKLWLLFSFTFHMWIAISLFTKSTTSSFQDQSLIMRLIHYNSILSPFYNKSSTIPDRANFAIRSSMARLAHLKAQTDGPFLPYIEGALIPSSRGTIFFVNVSVGEPPITQLLNMDTGSDLLWIQCTQCTRCLKPIKPIYNPRKSSSYAPIACHPVDCLETYRGHCDSDGYCAYSIRYMDGTNSSGVMAYEKFIFQMNNKDPAILPSLIFGCATKHTLKLPRSNGVLGLGANKASIVSAIGPRFSYCIGNITDSHYIHNHLILGNGAVVQGYLTSFQIRRGLYYVSLEGITVGHTEIPINPKEFKFNVLVDSGATLTYLARKVYEPFKAEVQKIIKSSFASVGEPVRFRKYVDLLCYKGNWKRDVANFPYVTLHLAEGSEIDMDSESLFFQVEENTFCMAVNTKNERNVIGILAQQYYNVGFDLEAKKVSFNSLDYEVIGNSFSSMQSLHMI